jgi:hypothetical protein
MEEKIDKPSDEEISDKVTEPLEAYFQSPGFLKSFKRISFSTQKEQEDANRIFSASLTPLQRLEYLYILNRTFLSEYIKDLPTRFTKIYFD